MDEDALMRDAWDELGRLAAANPTTARYTWWAKLNLEPDTTLVTINKAMFRAALRAALDDNELADWREFLAHLDRKAAG